MKKQNVQIIGNYMRPLERQLVSRGVNVVNIIDGCNPLAMVGKTDSTVVNELSQKISTDNQIASLLNQKKNLCQMLSRKQDNFCENMIDYPLGKLPRNHNDADWLIISNSGLAYFICKINDSLFSDVYPVDGFMAYCNDHPEIKKFKIPFPEDFNWKYYYDLFIKEIMTAFEGKRIILVKTFASQWVMDGDNPKYLSNRSGKVGTFLRYVDEYFVQKTGCKEIDVSYSFIPEKKRVGALPGSCYTLSFFEELCGEIINIINNPQNDNSNIINTINDFSKIESYYYWITEWFSPKFINENEENITSIIQKQVYDIKYLMNDEKSPLFNIVNDLKPLFIKGEKITLTDYLVTKTENNIEESDIQLLETYFKCCNVTLDDIISAYKIYELVKDKYDFKKMVYYILNNNHIYSLQKQRMLIAKNISFLKEYPYIDKEVVHDFRDNYNRCVCRLENDNYLIIDLNAEVYFEKRKIVFDQSINPAEVIDKEMIIESSKINSLTHSLSFYIERARKGFGKKPITLLIESLSEFKLLLSIIDFEEICRNEPFYINVAGITNNFNKSNEFIPTTDLTFLFEEKIIICYLRSGMTDQICRYVTAKRLQAHSKANLYVDDLFFYRQQWYYGFESKKLIKENLSKKLFSEIFSPRLQKSFINEEFSANALYNSGADHIVALSCSADRFSKSHYLNYKGNKMLYVFNINNMKESVSNFLNINLPSLYTMDFTRPETLCMAEQFDITEYIQFPPHDSEINIKLEQKMRNCCSVVLHIRRSDMITLGFDVDIDYYKVFLQYLKKADLDNIHFFVFSDDISWCREHIGEFGVDIFPESSVTFVNHNKGEDSYRDMQLMSNAKIIVGTNSGFSRLAAWMSKTCEIFVHPNKLLMKYFQDTGKNQAEFIKEYMNR